MISFLMFGVVLQSASEPKYHEIFETGGHDNTKHRMFTDGQYVYLYYTHFDDIPNLMDNFWDERANFHAIKFNGGHAATYKTKFNNDLFRPSDMRYNNKTDRFEILGQYAPDERTNEHLFSQSTIAYIELSKSGSVLNEDYPEYRKDIKTRLSTFSPRFHGDSIISIFTPDMHPYYNNVVMEVYDKDRNLLNRVDIDSAYKSDNRVIRYDVRNVIQVPSGNYYAFGEIRAFELDPDEDGPTEITDRFIYKFDRDLNLVYRYDDFNESESYTPWSNIIEQGDKVLLFDNWDVTVLNENGEYEDHINYRSNMPKNTAVVSQVIKTADEGYLIAGAYHESEPERSVATLMKFDSDFNMSWMTNWDNGIFDRGCMGLVESRPGEYFVGIKGPYFITVYMMNDAFITDVEDSQPESGISVFPNPAQRNQNKISVKRHKINKDQMVQIYDSNGKLFPAIYQFHDERIDILPQVDMTPGIYLISIIGSDGLVSSEKLIVQ
jgi:hypothetical protein